MSFSLKVDLQEALLVYPTAELGLGTISLSEWQHIKADHLLL